MLSRVGSKNASKGPTGPSVAQPAPRSPPTDPLPPAGTPRPGDVLVARLNELKRLVKSFAAHWAAIALAEEAHGRALRELATSEAMRLPWLEQSLFLPYTEAEEGEDRKSRGWASVQAHIKDATSKEAEEHFELARTTDLQIVEPLKRLHLGIKAFIADLDKQLGTLSLEVVKERETSMVQLRHLASAVATYNVAPLSVPAAEDPVIVRAAAEQQMHEQVARENELLRPVLMWQDKTREFEKGVLEKVVACWGVWQAASAKCSSAAQNHTLAVGKLIEAIPSEAEWAHFASLNYLLPATMPARDPAVVDYPERGDHPSTKPIKEGILERRKRVVKKWKEAYFVLTPSGYLHEYQAPFASTSLASPTISLSLPKCTLSPLSESSLGSKGGKDKPASFSIEGRKSTLGGTVQSAFGLQHREIGRSYRAQSYAEAQDCWNEISKLTKAALTAHEGGRAHRAGTAGHVVTHAGMPAFVEHEGAELSAEEEEETAGHRSVEEQAQAHPRVGEGEVRDVEPLGYDVPANAEQPGTVVRPSKGEALAAEENKAEQVQAEVEKHHREPSMPGHFALEETPGSPTTQSSQLANAPAYTPPPTGAVVPPLEKQAAPLMSAGTSGGGPALPPRAAAEPVPAPKGTVETAAAVMRDTPATTPSAPTTGPPDLAQMQGIGSVVGPGAAADVGEWAGAQPKERRRSSWLSFGTKGKKK